MLNGQPLKLHGVDLHNDEGALGSVDNYDAMYRQMSNLKAMGVNAFRTSHNPPSPELHRHLPAARHRDDGGGLRRLGHGQAVG